MYLINCNNSTELRWSGVTGLVGLTAVLALTFASVPTHADTPPAFTVRVLPTLPGGTKGWAMDVTPLGDVVGYSSTSAHTTPHGFYYDAVTGLLTDMGTLSGNPADESYAYGIANTGYACGASEYGAGSNRDAFIWAPGLPMLPIGLPPAGHAIGSANDIEFDPGFGLHNAVGHTLEVVNNAPHATLWQWELGTSTCLGTLTGNAADWSRAFGVNSFGEVVGMSTRGGQPTHAFIYRNQQMIDIDGRVTGGSSSANSVNTASQVVGFYEPTANGTDYAVRWESLPSVGWTTTQLFCLPGSHPLDAAAQEINDAALIVGWSYDPWDGNKKACIWLNDTVYNLNNLISGSNPLTLMSAQGVNVNGQIVGYGLDVNGDEQAFILDPATLILNVPVPGIAGGSNDIYINGATPNKKVHLAYSLQPGTKKVPGCPGLVVDLKNPKVIGSPKADSEGTALVNVNVPNNAAGLTVYFQAAEVSSCRVSNRIAFTFF